MISLRHALLVAAGGMIGSVLRYAVASAIHARLPGGFPYGTLSVNLIGCLAIGVLGAWTTTRQAPATELWLFAAVGILGGFTTFSAFGWETFTLLRESGAQSAFMSVALHLALGLAAVWLGYAVMSRS